MPAELRTVDGVETLFHVPKQPTITIKVPKDAVVRYLTGETPVLPPAAVFNDAEDVKSARLNQRWCTAGWCPTYPPKVVQNTEDPLHIYYTKRGIDEPSWINYNLIGKVPHVDTPDEVVPWSELRQFVGYREAKEEWFQDPENGLPFYRIDTGWFEGVDSYSFLYGTEDPTLHFEHPDFPRRYREACLFTDMFSDFISTSSRYVYREGVRERNIPLFRASALVGFRNGYTVFKGLKVSVFFDHYDTGFTLDYTTGKFTDLGDPADEEFEANIQLQGNWFNPSYMSYNRHARSFTTIPKGARFSDIFTEYGTRGAAEHVLRGALDWNDSVSCDTPGIPFGMVAGHRRLKRCTPEEFSRSYVEYSPSAPLLLESSRDIKSVVDSLRATYDVGSLVRQNGLALSTTSQAVKSEDHHLLEMVSKGTVVPQGRRRWGRDPEHKRVYTPENAESFKTYLIEGQDSDALRPSVLPSMNQWEFLMAMGKVVEDFNAWIKDGKKKDQKVMNQWERQHPDGKLPWVASDPFFRVKLEVV